jgi:hypothetical protein
MGHNKYEEKAAGPIADDNRLDSTTHSVRCALICICHVQPTRSFGRATCETVEPAEPWHCLTLIPGPTLVGLKFRNPTYQHLPICQTRTDGFAPW